jgi:hypothetical protein
MILGFLVSVVGGQQGTAKDGQGEGLRVVLGVGPSIPSEHFADVYGLVGTNRSSLWQAYNASASLGIHASGRLRFGLSEQLSVVASAAYHRFAGLEQTATLENGQRLVLTSVTNVVPIAAGFQYFLVRSIVSPYVAGDVGMTTTSVTVNEPSSSFASLLQAEGIELSPRTARFGGSIGFGIEFKLNVLDPFIEFRYSGANIVGRGENEVLRTFYAVTVGVTL